MASWARRPNPSCSSFQTLPSSSSFPFSSAASLPAASVLDLADDLWFYRSVLPLPPIALPCFPPVSFPAPSSSSSPPPDTSTLLAQCMRDRARFSPTLPPSPPPPADLDQTNCDFCYLPPPDEDADSKDNVHFSYGYGYSSLSESDDDDGWYYARPTSGEDEEAFHYYSATSDWEDEDAFNGYLAVNDLKDESSPQVMREDQLPAYPQKERPYFEPDDILSGIHDAAASLKRQYQEKDEEREKHTAVPSPRLQQEGANKSLAIPQIHVLSRTNQADMKENLKLWAHAVALTLPLKAAAKARPLL